MRRARVRVCVCVYVVMQIVSLSFAPEPLTGLLRIKEIKKAKSCNVYPISQGKGQKVTAGRPFGAGWLMTLRCTCIKTYAQNKEKIRFSKK